MTSRAAPTPDPAYPAMALDLLGNMLARADNPGALARYLTDELRELTGARCVVFLQRDASTNESRIVRLAPDRRRDWGESPAARRVFAIASALDAATIWRSGESEAAEILRADGFELSFAIPLLVGSFHVGAMLVLGVPDAAHSESIRALLDTLSTVVALVMRNAALYERQEQIISERTAELLRANEELRRSRDRFELALAGTHGLWDWDLRAGRLEADWRWMGAPAGEPTAIEGEPRAIVDRLVHRDDAPHVRDALARHLSGESAVFEAEFRPTGQDGRRWVLARGRVGARDEAGRPCRMTGVVSDVTQRREMQGQLERSERMASLGTLAAGVAHEINNPLTFIDANLAFIGEHAEAPGEDIATVRQAVLDARDGVARVKNVVMSLKAFSSPVPRQRTSVDVAAELNAALRLTSNEIRHRAALSVEIAPMPRVVAGLHELGQVFVNLLVNAAQAIREGRAGENRIEVVAGTDGAGRARIEIRDSGVGIPEDHLKRIFQPFFTTKRQGVGTGLGLSICHGVVTAAGGSIEVETALGAGSVFRVLLPPAPAADDAERGTAPALTSAVTEERRARVLIVDDEPLVGRAARRLVATRHEALVVESAAEALDRIARGERFDVVLCDLMMPGVGGMDLHARLRRCCPEVAERMVFMTGGAFTERTREFLASGVRHVEKPFDTAALLGAIDAVLKRSR